MSSAAATDVYTRQAERPLSALTQWLPVNYVTRVRACLSQGRAIEAVEAEDGARILIWSFIPDPVAQRVLARCRDASVEVREAREATQARRLYRLITENTTDLISRHTPDGCFLDASPASWTLLGYWPAQLRGVRERSLLLALLHLWRCRRWVRCSSQGSAGQLTRT